MKGFSFLHNKEGEGKETAPKPVLNEENSLGLPPKRDATYNNLQQPDFYYEWTPTPDGRRLHKPWLKEQFNIRVVKGLKQKVKEMSERDGISMGHLIELAVKLYETEHNKHSL